MKFILVVILMLSNNGETSFAKIETELDSFEQCMQVEEDLFKYLGKPEKYFSRCKPKEGYIES